MQDCGFCYAIPSLPLYKQCGVLLTGLSDRIFARKHDILRHHRTRHSLRASPLWALGFGGRLRSIWNWIDGVSRVATDWAHRVRGSQNGTKESTRQSKLRSMMLREYYLLFPAGNQQESHKTSWIGYVFQSMGIREHVVICSAIRNSRINYAFPNGGCHMWRQQRKGRDSRKTKIASQSIVRFCWQKRRE